MVDVDSLAALIGCDAKSLQTQSDLETIIGACLSLPEQKSFANELYLNFYEVGLSLYCRSPRNGQMTTIIEELDIYNPVHITDTLPRSGRLTPRKSTFARFPAMPLSLKGISLLPTTTGKELVTALGEPSKKGGGVGWVDVWLEWDNLGIQVELVDPKGNEVVTEQQQKKGMGGVWDRAAEWRWGVLKVFRATT